MEDQVKLPASSYEEVAKIIAAYASHGKEASLDDISKLTSMNRTMVSGNNGFLSSIGLIEGGNRKTATSLGRQLGLAIEHSQLEEIARQWRSVASENTFLRNLVSAVRIRRGMDAASLRAHVAYSAGLAKTKGVMTGTGTVIEILKIAGLLAEQDGKLVASSEPISAASDNFGTPLITQSPPSPPPTNVNVYSASRGSSKIPITIQINVSCSSDDLEDLGTKLKKLIEDLEADSGDGD